LEGVCPGDSLIDDDVYYYRPADYKDNLDLKHTFCTSSSGVSYRFSVCFDYDDPMLLSIYSGYELETPFDDPYPEEHPLLMDDFIECLESILLPSGASLLRFILVAGGWEYSHNPEKYAIHTKKTDKSVSFLSEAVYQKEREQSIRNAPLVIDTDAIVKLPGGFPKHVAEWYILIREYYRLVNQGYFNEDVIGVNPFSREFLSKTIPFEHWPVKYGISSLASIRHIRQKLMIPDAVSIARVSLKLESGVHFDKRYSAVICVHLIGPVQSLISWRLSSCDTEDIFQLPSPDITEKHTFILNE
jgi:hypothetical protein